MRNWILCAWILAGVTIGVAEELTSEQQTELMVSIQTEDYDKIIELTDKVDADSEWMRARAGAFQRRGEEHFFDADIEGSIEDFDAFLEIIPQQDPHHWQRGLS